MTLEKNPNLRITVFTSLYFSQGVPTGFVTITITAIWANLGYSSSDIAMLLVISYLPWALKIFFAPFVDGHTSSKMGSRRPWIILSQAGMIITLLIMTMISGLIDKMILLGSSLFIYNSFCSLQDVSTDALAINYLEKDERGRVYGLMWGGKIFGIAFGGLGLSTIHEYFGFDMVLWTQIILLFSVLILPLRIREKESDSWLSLDLIQFYRSKNKKNGFSLKHLIKEIKYSFKPTSIRMIGILALVAALPTRMLVVIGPVFTISVAGWTSLGYSQFAGGPALLFGILGAITGGFLSDKLGRNRTLIYAQIGLFSILMVFSTVDSLWLNSGLVALFIGLGVFFDLVLKTTLGSLFMDVTDKKIAATQFTIFMTLGNLCNVLGALLIIPLDHVFKFAGLFMSAAVLCLGIILFLKNNNLQDAFIPVGVKA